MSLQTVKQLRATLNTPAYRLIAATAYRNWLLLGISLSTNIFGALLEGSTLGVIYLAVSLLSNGSQNQQPQLVKQILSIVPLTESQQFIGLLGVAVLLQSLLALSNYRQQDQHCLSFGKSTTSSHRTGV
jgi:ATP-binding cassette subfamily B protein/subfamily B ATP-binding cassette protein MsbA